MGKEIKGLGDLVEKITEVTGVKTVVETVTEALGIEDCGCQRRKDSWNKAVPFGKQSVTPTPNHPQDDALFKSGKYLVLNNFTFNINKTQYSYNIGDQIYIKEEDSIFESLKTFYKLGIIIEFNE